MRACLYRCNAHVEEPLELFGSLDEEARIVQEVTILYDYVTSTRCYDVAPYWTVSCHETG